MANIFRRIKASLAQKIAQPSIDTKTKLLVEQANYYKRKRELRFSEYELRIKNLGRDDLKVGNIARSPVHYFKVRTFQTPEETNAYLKKLASYNEDWLVLQDEQWRNNAIKALNKVYGGSDMGEVLIKRVEQLDPFEFATIMETHGLVINEWYDDMLDDQLRTLYDAFGLNYDEEAVNLYG